MRFISGGAGLTELGLTELQQAYEIGRRPSLELGGVSPRCYLEFECAALDLDRLRGVVTELHHRHDLLGDRLVSADRQRIEPGRPVTIAVEDLTGSSAGDQERALVSIRRRIRETDGVDTGAVEPIRFAVTRLSPGRDRLHVAAELIFLDLPSLQIVMYELAALLAGDELPAAEPGWERLAMIIEAQDAPRDQADRDYWLGRLDGLPGRPELPLALAPEQIDRPRFDPHRRRIDADTWRGIKDAAAGRGLRPAAVLLAGFAEVVRTWSKNSEFLLTVTGRHRSGSAVGPFAQPALFEVSGTCEQTLLQRARALQERLDDDAEHAGVSGLEVLRVLNRESGDGRVTAPVVFTTTVDTAAPDGIAELGELIELSTATPQVWLENQVIESGGGLIINWHAVAGLFPSGVIEAMIVAYEGLLRRIAADPSVWDLRCGVISLPESDAAERRRANATGTEIPAARLHDLVAVAALRTPDAIAVIDAGGAVSHGELAARSYRIARSIRSRADVRPGELVAVSLGAGSDQIAAILGVLHAGGAYVCIDPVQPRGRRESLLDRCGVRCLISDSASLGDLDPGDRELIMVDDEDSLGADIGPVDGGQSADDLAYVIFTSGSTGEPKGVMITHRSAANTVQDINRRYGVGPEDRVLALAPTNFDLSVYDIFGVLSAGGAMIIPDPARAADPEHWTELVRCHRVTVWNSVPAPVRLWIDQLEESGADGIDDLRLVLMSGDWIPVDLPGRIRRRLPETELISLGGATEGSIWSIFHPIGEVPPEWTSIPYGKPLTNQTMHVLNRWLEPCPTWVTGEIHIGGIGVAQGYWADPVRTAERFILDPGTASSDQAERLYRTGDLGRYLPGGDIEILGREDHQVKINGYRVELGEIEACLIAAPEVRQVIVTAPRHPRTEQRQLAAYLVPEGPVPSTDVLRERCAATLPGYMVPSHFVIIDAIPLTGNGKIDRGALPELWTGDEGPAARVAPADDVERRVAAVWARQLGHDDFGMTEGFFDVGGDSLHAVGILRELRNEFGVDAAGEQALIESLFLNADLGSFTAAVRQAAL